MTNAAKLVERCRDELLAAGVHFGHGTDNALDEAAWLVLHVLHQPLDGSFDTWEMDVGSGPEAEILGVLERRIDSRVPLAYLLKEAWFCGMRFEVGPDVLVPRSPLAELIPAGFSPWINVGEVRKALDLCTGSGCIAIAMAAHMPGVAVTAADISAPALAIARRNVALHGMETRVELVESDLFTGLAGRRFDLVVSNPPYVPSGSIDSLPGEYRAEPAVGLVSGADGLEFPLRILLDAANYLEEHGVLICEVGESAGALQELLADVPFTWLEFEHGGEGVFTMDRSALEAAQPRVRAALAE